MKLIKIIEAGPFKFGMEDGVRNGKRFFSRDAHDYKAIWAKESKKYPGYLEMHDGYLDYNGLGFGDDEWQPYIGEFYDPEAIVYKGDWITSDRKILRKDDRKRNYKKYKQ